MPLTFLLLQLTNLVLAAASLWLHFKNPLMWDDQAVVVSICAGTLSASLTAILLGITLAFGEETKWGPVLLNLFLTLAFGGLQGYLLFMMGRDMGIVQMVKARLGY
jgi:hypothetical protein